MRVCRKVTEVNMSTYIQNQLMCSYLLYSYVHHPLVMHVTHLESVNSKCCYTHTHNFSRDEASRNMSMCHHMYNMCSEFVSILMVS